MPDYTESMQSDRLQRPRERLATTDHHQIACEHRDEDFLFQGAGLSHCFLKYLEMESYMDWGSLKSSHMKSF